MTYIDDESEITIIEYDKAPIIISSENDNFLKVKELLESDCTSYDEIADLIDPRKKISRIDFNSMNASIDTSKGFLDISYLINSNVSNGYYPLEGLSKAVKEELIKYLCKHVEDEEDVKTIKSMLNGLTPTKITLTF